MNSWTSRASLVVLLTVAACNSAPPAQPPSQPIAAPTPAAEPAPVAEQAPKSEAIARADALLEDFKRRQEAQEKYDREHPLPAAAPLPGMMRPAPSGAPSSTPPAAGWPATTPSGAAASTGRDEKWWKDQMQDLELKLNEELIRLAQAEKLNLKNGYNDAQAEYKKIVAAVANARQAIDRLRDEARRAGVPPSWLR